MAASRARRDFHLALLGILLPVVSLPVVWILALRHRGAADAEESSPWPRLLLALAWLDTVVAGILLSGVLQHLPAAEGWHAHTPRWTIGIFASPDEEGTLVVDRVLPGSPAERGGLRTGDAILRVGDREVKSLAELSDTFQSDEVDRSHRVRLRRDGTVIDLRVHPERRESTGLFTIVPGDADSPFSSFLMLAPAAAVLGVLALRGRGRGGWNGLLLRSAALLAVLIGVQVVVGVGILLASDGWSPAATIFPGLAGNGAAVLLGVLWLRGAGDGIFATGGRLLGTLLLGGLQIGLLWPRLAWTVWLVRALAARAGVVLPDEDPVGSFDALNLDALPLGLLVFLVVVVGPAAEELWCRGLLLGWCRRWMGDGAALVASSVVFALMHPHYGFGVVVMFVFGVTFAWARLRTGGLLAPFLLHAGLNALASIPLFLAG